MFDKASVRTPESLIKVIAPEVDELSGVSPFFEQDIHDNVTPALPDTRELMSLAFVDIEEAVREELGDDAYGSYLGATHSAEMYSSAADRLRTRQRRGRFAMLGFGVLATFTFLKSGERLVEYGPNYFESSPAIGLTYPYIQDCYEEPAKTQLDMQGEWRDVEPSDNNSVGSCLEMMADQIDEGLQESESNEVVKPFVGQYGQLSQGISDLSEDPRLVPPASLVAEEELLKEALEDRDDYFFNKQISGMLLGLLGTVLAALGAASGEVFFRSKKALGLLRQLRAHGYNSDDVLDTLRTELREVKDEPESVVVHALIPIGTEHEKSIVYLPHDGKVTERKRFARSEALSALRDALYDAK